MAVLIKGGRLVTGVDSYNADILVEDESISAVGRGLDAPDGAEIVDATGLLVLPGVIDPHVHVDLELKGHRSSDFTSTSRSAALGGVTTFITYITPAVGRHSWKLRNSGSSRDEAGVTWTSVCMHRSFVGTTARMMRSRR